MHSLNWEQHFVKTLKTLKTYVFEELLIVRDQPFNLKGGGGGGYVFFLFRSEIIFRTTQELEYIFYLSRKARIFFPRI